MFDTEYQPVFLIGFAVYIALMVVIGALASRKSGKGEDFLTAGRKLPLLLTFSTIGATMVGTQSSIGVISNSFRQGFTVMVFVIGSLFGLLLMRIFTNARDKDFLTMSEEAQYYFGGNALIRYTMGFIMLIVEVAWLGNHINGGAIYLSYVTGIDFIAAKLFTVIAFGAYVFIGGYLAVVWTDVIQFAILIAGFTIIAINCIPLAGGMSAINAAFAAKSAAALPSAGPPGPSALIQVLALTAATVMGILGTPTHRTRIYTAKNSKTAKRAFTMNAILLTGYGILPVLIGMSAYTIAAANNATAVLERPDFAFAYMATTILGPTFGLFLLLAGLSATLSSADSDAISGVTILLTDIYPTVAKKALKENSYVKYSRVSLLVILFLSFLMTMLAGDIISYITKVIGALIPGIAVTMLLGRLVKRATWQGGLAALLSGTVCGFVYLFVKPFAALIDLTMGGPAIPVTILSLALGLITSFLTPKNNVSGKDALAAVFACRRAER